MRNVGGERYVLNHPSFIFAFHIFLKNFFFTFYVSYSVCFINFLITDASPDKKNLFVRNQHIQ